jgi:hypothetical protein
MGKFSSSNIRRVAEILLSDAYIVRQLCPPMSISNVEPLGETPA